MNRIVDYRGDFYSLGVIFYQMLTGELPFHAEDPLEWVHCHIARVPRPPTELAPSIPRTASDIVMKLLAKTAEERYQTAAGLGADLERCLAQWTAEGAVEPFALGSSDLADQLLIPQKLYGREADIVVLQQAFERVASQGAAEMVLLAGYSGIGKSSLVWELPQPVARKGGLFISGKFDQYRRNIPYLTIAEAFRELIRQILTEEEARIARWRERFQEALGTNARLLIEIIPQFELIVGPQPPVQELPPKEAQQRFHRVFRQFVAVFTQPATPLIVFLDDLQWVDPASLELLVDLITDVETRDLMLVGAYRDNEVSPSHPLLLALDEIFRANPRVQTRTLSSLTAADLDRFLTDTFHCSSERLAPLSALIYRKTAGNPFFAIQFLKTLHAEKLVVFNKLENRWTWDIARIEALDFTDNVVDLVVAKLRKLTPGTRGSLELAACIGNKFTLHTLATIGTVPEKKIRERLEEAHEEGLVLSLSDDTWAFIHDRVQQAAHSLIPEGERAEVHVRIGRLLLQHANAAETEEYLFDIVHQFNQGIGLLTDPTEKYRVCELNLMAGRKAKISTAYIAALTYLCAGTRLLPEETWEENHALAFESFKELATVEFLNSNYLNSKKLIEMLLDRTETLLEKAELFNILIVQQTLTADYADAIRTGRKALQQLGSAVPETDLKGALASQLEENRRLLADRPIASLFDDPPMADPEKIAILELMSNMVVPARYTDSTLFALITVLNVNFSLRFGLTGKSTVGYTAFGMVLNSEMGRYAEALEFGELALRLSERFHAPTQKCQACFMIGHYLNHWVRHLKWADAILNDGIQAGLASGEMQWTGYTFAYKLFQPFYAGVKLELVEAEIPKLLFFPLQTRNHWAIDTLHGIRLVLSELSESVAEDLESPSEEDFFAACEEHRSFGAKGRYAVLKAQALYLTGRTEEALEMALLGRKLVGFFSSSISVAELNFYHSLILADLYEDASPAQQAASLEAIGSNLRQMKTWADHCPENFLHLRLLVEAELARLTAREMEGERFYEWAIQAATEQDFTQDLALANELASRFYQQRGFVTIAATYRREAHRCYILWGAKAKARLLEEQFPTLLRGEWAAAPQGNGTIGSRLDAISVAKASQAISGNIHLPDLLDTLMRIVIEHAGAQKGSFVLVKGEELSIEARARVTEKGVIVRLGSSPLRNTLLPVSLLNYVRRTGESIILKDAQTPNLFSDDRYFVENGPSSVLCLPILRQSGLIGLLYLENNLARNVFTPDQIAVLELLAAQAAISLENAGLYLEQSRAETALRVSEEKYRAIFDNSGTALIFIEDDMTISLCNKEFEKLYGAEKPQIEGRIKWPDLVAREEDLVRMKKYHRARRVDPYAAPQTYEFQMICRGGELKELISSVTILPGTRQSMASMVDISERKRTVEALHESERKFRAIFDQTFQYIGMLTVDGILLEANRAALELSGAEEEEVVGKPFWETRFWTHSTDLQQQLKAAIAAAAKGEFARFEATHPAGDGTLRYVDFSLKPVKNDAGEVVLLVPEGRDITERKYYEQQLEHQATHDALTSLANRHLLEDRLGQNLIWAKRSQRHVALLLLDLDRFKVVNDSLGHSQGDELLRLVAERLIRCVRPGDTVGRLGGDEFLVALAGVAELDDVGLMAKKIRDTLAEPFPLPGHDLRVTASIGISLYPKDGQEVDTLVCHADIAMYRAKEEGGDTFRFFGPEMNERVQGTLKLEADLRQALDRQEFLLHYQPKVDIASGRIIGCEALVRWHSPQRGLVSPGAFIPLAEETGLIVPLGAWVLRKACAQARAWQEKGLPFGKIAVNLSARQFRQAELIDQVRNALQQAGLSPEFLDLELTESMIMQDPARAADTMRQLKELGVGLCLDDFGTGYSSLNYLRRFPVDYLKIDRSFICDVTTDPSEAAVTRSIVAIAHSLGIAAVAEGVESWGQYDFLVESRCDALQGFLFSQPLEAAKFAHVVREERSLKR